MSNREKLAAAMERVIERLDEAIASEYTYEDTDGRLLLIGSEDDGRVYVSVQDREPVVLTPDQAEAAGRQLLARAVAGRR